MNLAAPPRPRKVIQGRRELVANRLASETVSMHCTSGERYPMCPMYPMTAECLLSLDSARPEYVPPPEIAYIGGDMLHSPTSTPAVSDNLEF